MADKKINGSVEITGVLNPNSNGFGISLPNTSGLTESETLATLENIQTISGGENYVQTGTSSLNVAQDIYGKKTFKTAPIINSIDNANKSSGHVASFTWDRGSGSSVISTGHFTAYGDDDSSENLKPTDAANAEDLDTQYFNTGITTSDSGDVVSKISFPNLNGNAGTFVTSVNGTEPGADGNVTIATASHETDITLGSDLWTDTKIGHINASAASPTKIAVAGDSLKDVFNAVFGTITETQPSITQPASISMSFNGKPSTEEYGTAHSTIDYTLSADKGSYTYGPSTDVQFSNYSVSTGGSVVATSQTGTITLSSAYVVGVSSAISFSISANNTQGAIAKTNLGNDSNPVVRIASGTVSNTKSYSINSDYYTYYKVTNSNSAPGSTGWTAVGSNTIQDIIIEASAGQYIWIASTQNKTNIYEWNDVSGKYNTDPTATTKSSNQTLHTTTDKDVNTYYFYRTTNARTGYTNKKFKLG